MAIRRVRSKLGDLFLIPLEPNPEQYTNDGYGEYVPEASELFILSQFVFGETKDVPLLSIAGMYRTIMCFGEPLRFDEFKPEASREFVSKSTPSMEFRIINEPMNRSWWPKLCSSDVSAFLPHQSYGFKSDRVIDYHAKVEAEKANSGFRNATSSVNSSMAEALCAHIFGVRDAGFPDFDYNDYLVTEERAVWNVFPERYKLDFSRGLLFDGVSASQSYQGGE